MASLREKIYTRLWMLYSRVVPIGEVNLSNFPHEKVVLNLGCGTDIRPGWVNIDAGVNPYSCPAGTVVVNYDLRRGLPFRDGSIDVVYSSHFFEHLNTIDGLALMKKCWRAMKSGGMFRAAMPDARLPIRAYLDGDSNYFAKASQLLETDLPAAELRSSIDHIDLFARGWEHKALYHPDKVMRLLKRAGFISAKVVDFDPAYDISDELRRFFSFYLEAQKP